MMPSELGSRSRMRTYANRIKKDSLDAPAAKRVCIEATRPLQDISNVVPVALPPVAKAKRSIADYFNVPTSSSNPSTPDTKLSPRRRQGETRSSSPLSTETLTSSPPSSPPPSKPYDTYVNQPIRKRRRLTTRPQILQSINMYPPNGQDPADAMGSKESVCSDYFKGWDKNTANSGEETRNSTDGKVRANKDPTPEYFTDHFAEKKPFTYPTYAQSSSYSVSTWKPSNLSSVNPPKTKLTNENCTVEDDDSSSSGTCETSSSEGSNPASSGADNGLFTLYPGLQAEHSPVVPVVFKSGKPRPKNGPLTQTILNLGQTSVIACHICKFPYNKAVLQDVQAHMDFHDEFLEPFSVSKLNFHSANAPKKLKEVYLEGEYNYIVCVTDQSPEPWKKMAAKAVNFICEDVNAEPILPKELWEKIDDPGVKIDGIKVFNEFPVDRFKVYLYVSKDNIASVLLAERIASGIVTKFKIEPVFDDTNESSDSSDSDDSNDSNLPSDSIDSSNSNGPNGSNNADDSSDANNEQINRRRALALPYPTYTDDKRDAKLGINYIWTRPEYRKKGFAGELIDAGRRYDFLPGVHIGRGEVAWTPLTSIGCVFAGWYVREYAHEQEWDLIMY